jgi:hypothetical protein
MLPYFVGAPEYIIIALLYVISRYGIHIADTIIAVWYDRVWRCVSCMASLSFCARERHLLPPSIVKRENSIGSIHYLFTGRNPRGQLLH